jgi:hypothetical protein
MSAANAAGLIIGATLTVFGIALAVFLPKGFKVVRSHMRILFGQQMAELGRPWMLGVAAAFSVVLGVAMVCFGATGSFS